MRFTIATQPRFDSSSPRRLVLVVGDDAFGGGPPAVATLEAGILERDARCRKVRAAARIELDVQNWMEFEAVWRSPRLPLRPIEESNRRDADGDAARFVPTTVGLNRRAELIDELGMDGLELRLEPPLRRQHGATIVGISKECSTRPAVLNAERGLSKHPGRQAFRHAATLLSQRLCFSLTPGPREQRQRLDVIRSSVAEIQLRVRPITLRLRIKPGINVYDREIAGL